LLVRLRRDLKDVESAPGAGLSAVEVDEIARLAANVRLVGEHAQTSDRRLIVALVNLRAVVGQDGEQILIQSRPERSVAMRFTGAIEISPSQNSDCATSFLKYELQLLSLSLKFVA